MVTDTTGRPRWLLAALAALVVAIVTGTAGSVSAAPNDPDGGNGSLQAKLDAANKGYLDAKALLDGSKARQAAMQTKIQETEQQLTAMRATATQLATAAYRNNALRTTSALLSSVSPENFVDRVNALHEMANNSQRKLHAYAELRRQLADQKAAIDGEIAQQELQLAEMDKRRNEAQKALTASGGGQNTSGPTGKAASATPAPRNANGSWPPESCSVDDPTTTGCITPRMLHAYQQARAAGFTRFTSCYRSAQDGGEHPKGRAGDFSATPNGFVDARASGGDKTYGDNLAAYFIANSDNLAVLYVIWYDRIWQAATGNWKTYTAGDGSPAGDHYNHVHLSVI